MIKPDVFLRRQANLYQRADIAFVGADSFVPGKGAFSVDEESAALAAAIARCADRKVVVIDHGKLGAKGCCRILASKEIDCLVTDGGLDAKLRKALEREPFKLIVAT